MSGNEASVQKQHRVNFLNFVIYVFPPQMLLWARRRLTRLPPLLVFHVYIVLLQLSNTLSSITMASSPSAAASRSFIVIVAATAGSLGIGKNGALPWRLAADMAYFKRCTSTPSTAKKVNAVIMGRKTWQSIPDRFRPLQGRRNVVLSRNPTAREDLLLPEDVLLAGSLSEALGLLSLPPHAVGVDKVFVIGGGSVYTEAVASNLCEKVLLTSVRDPDGRFEDCDVHFPPLKPDAFELVQKGAVQEEKGIEFSFDEYESVLHSVAGATAAAAVTAATAASGSSSASCGGGNNKENAPSDSPTETGVGSKRKADQTPGIGGNGENAEVPATQPSSSVGIEDKKEGGGGENEEEMQYLKLVQDILDNGVKRGDRTGTGTLSKFGVQMRFSLREGRFPLLTTKRVFWRGVAEELLWFISGCTNAKVLQEKGIHIWDGNGSREFLDG